MTRWFELIMPVRPVGLIILLAGILAVGGCGSSPQVQDKSVIDQNLERLNRAARQAFDKGRIEQAAVFYRKALERALVRDDSGAIVDAQYNLAVCLMKLNSPAQAMQLVQRAETELALADQKKFADLLLLKAMLLHRSAKPDEAWQITGQILSMTPQTTPLIRGRTHFLRGLIAAEREDIHQLHTEMTALGQPQNALLRGDLAELQGHLAMAEQDWADAVEAFDDAVKLRRETMDYQAMIKDLALAAKASERAGKFKGASQRYLRAGRSAALQGDHDAARAWLVRAEQLAAEAGEKQIGHDARLYLEQIQKADPSIQ
jgi:tetratricopeptide (TPR) repeat protein